MGGPTQQTGAGVAGGCCTVATSSVLHSGPPVQCTALYSGGVKGEWLGLYCPVVVGG